MFVFKFGGASVKDAKAVKNVAQVLGFFKNKNILVVISAMGKTTNALEKILHQYFHHKPWEENHYELVKYHFEIAQNLGLSNDIKVFSFQYHFDSLKEKLQQKPSQNFDFEYDQIVSFGELFSTSIISQYLNNSNYDNRLVMAQDFIKTNNRYRDAKVDWGKTEANIQALLENSQSKLMITQGFLGRDHSGHKTTLGREGSDFSASIFAYCLNAKSLTIWKDVAGVLSADPKKFDNTVKLDQISYKEAIELSYLGASVIHPKTVKPLQNKNIPLYVKSFVDPENEGTVVNGEESETKISSIIHKSNQTLLTISPKDFSFIAENHVAEIFKILNQLSIRVHLMQNSALNFSLVFDESEMKINQLIERLKPDYSCRYNNGLELITVRHYDDDKLNDLKAGKEIFLEQKTRENAKLLFQPKNRS